MEIEEVLIGLDAKTVALSFGFSRFVIPGFDTMSKEDVLRWCIANSPPALESIRVKFYRGNSLHAVCSSDGEILGLFETLRDAFDYMAPSLFQSPRLLVEHPEKLKEQYVLSILPELDRQKDKVYAMMVNSAYFLLKDDGMTRLDEEMDADQIAELFDAPVQKIAREVLYEERGRDVLCEQHFSEANLLVGNMLMALAWIGRNSAAKAPSRDELLKRAGVIISEEPLSWKGHKVNHRVFYCAPGEFENVFHRIELDSLRVLMSAKVLLVSKGANPLEVEAISTLAELNRHPLVAGF